MSDNQALHDEQLPLVIKQASTKLTDAMADLGRELREIISAPDQGPVLSAGVKSYTALFTARFVLRGKDGKYRFDRG